MQKKVVVLGAGWIGTRIAEELARNKTGLHFACPPHPVSKRIAAIQDVVEIIKEHDADVVINAIGKTGKPNIDWCEQNRIETYFSNVTVPYLIQRAAYECGVKMVHLSSGCIYEGEGPEGGWKETDLPNCLKSFYSTTKYQAEQLLNMGDMMYKNTLILRIRIPFSIHPHERNLFDKLAGFDKIVNVKNSLTDVELFINTLRFLLGTPVHGTYNVVCRGGIKFEEVMRMYKALVDPAKVFELITANELQLLVHAKRSNCVLSTVKLRGLGFQIPNVNKAIEDALITWNNNRKDPLP